MSNVIVIDDEFDSKQAILKTISFLQCDDDGKIYVCKNFRDPRRFMLETYLDNVKQEAISIDKIRDNVNTSFPLKKETKLECMKLAKILHEMASNLWEAAY